MDDFNFDEWANLAKNHPEEFERKRTNLLNSEIHKAPIEYRNNLRLLQLECDVYHNSMSPIEATVAISNLLDTKLNELKTHTELLRDNLK